MGGSYISEIDPTTEKRSEGTGKENKQLTLIGKEKYRNKANESLSRGKQQGQFNRLPPGITLEMVPGGTTSAQECVPRNIYIPGQPRIVPGARVSVWPIPWHSGY